MSRPVRRWLPRLIRFAWTITLLAAGSCGGEIDVPTAPELARGGGGAAALTVTPASLSFAVPPGTPGTLTASVQFVGPISAVTSDAACATIAPASVPATKAPGTSLYIATFSVTPVAPGTCTITITDKKGAQRTVSVEVLDGRAAGILLTLGLRLARVEPGNRVTYLTPSDLRVFSPSAPADGRRIAFLADHGTGTSSDLYIMNADGSGLHSVGTDPTTTVSWGGPSIAPDGERLVLSSYARSYNFTASADIYVINAADGKDVVELTESADTNEFEPVFSPDERRIAFVSEFPSMERRISIMDADGANRSDLGPGMDPAFAPDGGEIVFTSNRDGDFEIYVMSTDGIGVTQLTHNTGASDADPVYSPDGSRIAFMSDGGSGSQLHVMNTDGSGEFTVPLPEGLKLTPYWP
jgi:hypothetical protein